MLGKLIKQDFKAMARSLVPFLVAVFGASMLGVILSKSMACLTAAEKVPPILMTVLTMAAVILIMALYAAIFIGLILIVRRYYTNLMTDEGYLTLTLPVTAGQHVGGKLIAAVLWSLICGAVVCVCVFLFALFGTSRELLNVDVIRGLNEIFTQLGVYWTGGATVLLIEGVVFVLGALVFQILEIYLAITIGAMIATKHKVLAAVGLYFAINLAVGILATVLISTFAFTAFSAAVVWWEAENTIGLFQAMTGVYDGLYIVASVVFFLICRHLLKNRLNLA